MVAIHHAIAKRAEKLGVILEHLPDENEGEQFKAHWPKLNQVLFGGSAKTVLDDMAALIEIKQMFQSFKVTLDDPYVITGKGFKVTDKSLSFAFAQAKKAWKEQIAASADTDDADEIEDEDEDEQEGGDEEGRAGSVVKQKYRARYAEAGHPNTCGDWLAETLNAYTTNKAGFNLELFAEVCAMNGLNMSKYAVAKPSDRGRFKMTGRNMLARVVFLNGELLLHTGPVKAPAEWMQAQRFAKPAARTAPKTPKL